MISDSAKYSILPSHSRSGVSSCVCIAGMWVMPVYGVLAHAEVHVPWKQEMCFNHDSILSN